MRHGRRVLVFLLAPLALTCLGCGSSDTIRVTGKLVKGGANYNPPEGQRVALTFYAMELKDASGATVPSGEPFAAQYDPADGTFTIPGPEGRGIPPGKYRISVVQRVKSGVVLEPSKTPKKRKEAFDRESDFLKNRYGPESSPIIRELTSSTDLVIDLDNPSGG